jgi:hypothetical protein
MWEMKNWDERLWRFEGGKSKSEAHRHGETINGGTEVKDRSKEIPGAALRRWRGRVGAEKKELTRALTAARR